MKIKGYSVKQGNSTFFVGAMKVKDLINEGEVDRFAVGHSEGYQRIVSEARSRAFGRFVGGGGVSPASILLNIREGKVSESPEGVLNLPAKLKVWIVDGQHRVEGLKFAMEKDPEIGQLEFPIVLMNEPSGYEEAKQFVIINKTQKGVRTDLAERFLMQAVKKEGKGNLVAMREKEGVLRGILKNVEWVTKAIEITDMLNADKKHSWYGKIQMPNEPKARTTVAQGSFTGSLEPLLKDSFFEGKPAPMIAAALGNYWDTIKELCEDAFDNPKDFVIQKTTGVFVLHRIFAKVSELCRDEKGNRVLTQAKIKSVLKGLPFMKADYWGSKGTAGNRGTSRKAFSSLAGEALEILEAIEAGQENKTPNLVT